MYTYPALVFASLALFYNGATGAAIRRRASAGCGIDHNFPGQSREFSFESSGGTRTYRIHLPSNYDVNDPRPLLIAYHGSGGNPAGFEGETGFSDEGLNPNMITIYPAGVNVSAKSMRSTTFGRLTNI